MLHGSLKPESLHPEWTLEPMAGFPTMIALRQPLRCCDMNLYYEAPLCMDSAGALTCSLVQRRKHGLGTVSADSAARNNPHFALASYQKPDYLELHQTRPRARSMEDAGSQQFPILSHISEGCRVFREVWVLHSLRRSPLSRQKSRLHFCSLQTLCNTQCLHG